MSKVTSSGDQSHSRVTKVTVTPGSHTGLRRCDAARGMKTENYKKETSSNLHFNVTLAISVPQTKLLCPALGSGVIYSDKRTRETNEVVFWFHELAFLINNYRELVYLFYKRVQNGSVTYSTDLQTNGVASLTHGYLNIIQNNKTYKIFYFCITAASN